MKFLVLAIDFDGTTATGGVIDRGVLKAIALLRSAGIVVVLVTGRILDDLRSKTGDLHFVDAVVAENGAVIYFPDSGVYSVQAEPPPAAFISALKERRIAFAAGRVLVDLDAASAPEVLEIIRRLELPLVLAFNRGRLMVLPQSISKATGLRHALAILRLSPRNAVAIGDAENDHELLRACEVGVAVEWGSQALKAVADDVIAGLGPAAVAGYLTALHSGERAPMPLGVRRRLTLGHGRDGREFSLSVRGRNVLVAGDPKSGKSWVTGLLCEQLILYGYSVCIIDPEGDYLPLEALPGVRVLGGADPLPRPRELLKALRHADVSLVIDLSHVPQDQKYSYIRNVLSTLASFRRRTGLPHRIVVDEAHYFLHDPDVLQLLDLELNGYTLVSYRASRIHPGILAASQAILVTRESDPAELQALTALCTKCEKQVSPGDLSKLLGDITIGEAVVLPVTDEAQGEARRLRLIPRLTPHVRHLSKYIDVPVAESRGFVFSAEAGVTGRVRTLQEFAETVERVPLAAVEGHLRRGDFSRWVTDVFGDYPLAASIRRIENDFRRGRLQGVLSDLASAVRVRYEFTQPPEAAAQQDRG